MDALTFCIGLRPGLGVDVYWELYVRSHTAVFIMHAIKALLAQGLATLVIFLLMHIGVLPSGLEIPVSGLALLQGATASSIAHLLGCARWWLLIHLLFAPVLVIALWLNLPHWIYLGGFILLLLVYWNSFRTQVPLFLSNQQTVEQCVAWLPNDKPLRVLDMGSGTGSFARTLALLRPAWQVVGIENAPIPFWLSRWLGRNQANLQLLRGDFWQHGVAHYDIVYAFLSPVPMPALWEKLRHEMRPNTLLISNSFIVPGAVPEMVLEVRDRRQTQLYCYRVPTKNPGEINHE